MAVTAETTSDWTVRLTVSPAAAGTWYRSRSGEPDRAIGTSPTTVDLWAPLGVPVTYYWSPTTGTVEETAPVTVSPPGPVLSPVSGAGTMIVTVVTQPPLAWEGRSVAHTILGRPEPLVTIIKPTYHAATLRLHTATSAERSQLRGMLASGGPLILRAPCGDAVDDVTLLPLRMREELVSASKPAGPRWVDIDYQAVMDDPTRYDAPPAWTWADVETYPAAPWTWQEASAEWATWADMEANTPILPRP